MGALLQRPAQCASSRSAPRTSLSTCLLGLDVELRRAVFKDHNPLFAGEALVAAGDDVRANWERGSKLARGEFFPIHKQGGLIGLGFEFYVHHPRLFLVGEFAAGDAVN